MTRAQRQDAEADGATAQRLPSRSECSACAWLKNLLQCFSGSEAETPSSNTRPRPGAQQHYHAPAAPLPPVALRTVSEEGRSQDEASIAGSAEERSTLLPKWGEQSSTTRLARLQVHEAAPAAGEPSDVPLQRMATAPLGVVIGTPVAGAQQCPVFHDLASAAAAMRSVSATSKVVVATTAGRHQHRHQHRRTQSSIEYLVFRTSSRTSQGTALPTLQLHHAGRHTKCPQEFGKGFLPDLPCSVNTKAAIFAAAAAAGATAEDFDDDSHFCPTCLELYTTDNPQLVTSCGHHFHLPCLYAWLERKDTCPICSTTLVFEGM